MSSYNGIIPFANNVFKKIFLHWRQADEDETWSHRALKTLEKKLKERGDGSYALFFNVVLEKKSSNTPCVTLNRSQDGRIQVSHKKMLPHVLSCRITRWPDLQTHQELKSIDQCNYPGNDKKSKVCINPYHYQRVAQPVYPPVLRRTVTEECPDSAPFLRPSAAPSFQGFPIDYYSSAASMSPQSFNGSSASSYVSALSPGARSFESQTPPPGYNDVVMETDNRFVQNHPETIPDEPFDGNLDVWCKITYWELSSRVGEPFAARLPSFTIDGFINPANDSKRFSLGALYNINRNSCIEMTRRAIGSGVRIEKNQTEIFAKNLSKAPVFFLSRNHNVSGNFQPLDVIRVPPGCDLKIFDMAVFESLVRREMESPVNSYERVLSLNTHCSIKMSFVKGWGPDYQRQEVTSTPCWLDITLHEPLAYLDTKLRDLGSPNGHITSTS